MPSVAPLTQVQAAEFGGVITEMSLKNSSGGDLRNFSSLRKVCLAG